ncbi:hypothetical protein QJS10_CPB20g01039 [Acorus calamus]|uniref:Uncharacterized protein n=1 Tax=Acorus calamus TaxID=4465 RepID=A0AAV9C9J2_ACOCL|nr:hypothetical protein QJS10_CPB20g01039 [Acorus calamus]
MPYSRISGSLSSPNVDVVIDMGNPFLNRTVDGFLKIGTVSASRVAAEETYHCLRQGSVSSHKMKETKNALLGGAITGALVSAANKNSGDKVVTEAIKGGAVATAVEFLNYLT